MTANLFSITCYFQSYFPTVISAGQQNDTVRRADQWCLSPLCRCNGSVKVGVGHRQIQSDHQQDDRQVALYIPFEQVDPCERPICRAGLVRPVNNRQHMPLGGRQPDLFVQSTRRLFFATRWREDRHHELACRFNAASQFGQQRLPVRVGCALNGPRVGFAGPHYAVDAVDPVNTESLYMVPPLPCVHASLVRLPALSAVAEPGHSAAAGKLAARVVPGHHR